MKQKKDRFIVALNHLKSNGIIKTQADIANRLGTYPSNVSKAIKGEERYFTDSFLTKFSIEYGISTKWLLTGDGEMLTSNALRPSAIDIYKVGKEEKEPTGQLPLVPIEDIAGLPMGELDGVTNYEMYAIPAFVIKAGAHFLIRVSGDSMTPTYSNGDVIACKNVMEVRFLQWGEPYVLDTEQGAIIKRLKPIEGEEEYLLCISDNPSYPPFKIPRGEIRRICTIVAIIRLC